MAALTANAARKIRNIGGETRLSLTVLTGAKIYRHALVQITAAGKAEPCSNNTTATFAGVAVDEVDSGDGTVTVELFNDVELNISAVTAITAGMVNDTAIYAVNDNGVTNDNTLGPAVGIVTEYVAANDVWVRLRGQTLGVAS